VARLPVRETEDPCAAHRCPGRWLALSPEWGALGRSLRDAVSVRTVAAPRPRQRGADQPARVQCRSCAALSADSRVEPFSISTSTKRAFAFAVYGHLNRSDTNARKSS
jgi:hypothetical protein